ncbi:MAG: DUF6064 family protein [Azospirillaceae bacterium]
MPFTVDAFFAVFADYNAAIWPLQILAYLGGLVALLLLRNPSRHADAVILSILAAMWLVNGVAYHLGHFTAINPAAWLFGTLFMLQAALVGAARWLWPSLAIFTQKPRWVRLVAAILIAYALVLYPAIGHLAGHRYPAVPLFDVAPCPTTIFTIGVLLLGRWQTVRWLLIVPVLWSAIGGSAAVLLDVPQDYMLIASGLIVIAHALAGNRAQVP